MEKYLEKENFNEEFFLKCVTNFPVLYDLSKKGYSNRILTDKAWNHISMSMRTPVELCKKKWKSLREKYYREKQKMEMLTRSGAAASQTVTWPLMSFFTFMFDKKEPRKTASSVLLSAETQINTAAIDLLEATSSSPIWETEDENIDSQYTFFEPDEPHSQVLDSISEPINNNVTLSAPPSKTYKRGKKRTTLTDTEQNEGTEMLGILGKISTSMEKVSTTPAPDKITNFVRYVESEVRDLPQKLQEEFIDETIIRLLQTKRKFRSTLE